MKVLPFGVKNEFVDSFDVADFLHKNHLTASQITQDITELLNVR